MTAMITGPYAEIRLFPREGRGSRICTTFFAIVILLAACSGSSPKETLELIPVGPLNTESPSTSCQVEACTRLLGLIDSASERIDFAIYGMRNQPQLLKALLRAQRRGVRVRGLVDEDRYGKSYYTGTEELIEAIGTVRTDHQHDSRAVLNAGRGPALNENCGRPTGFEGPLQCVRYDLGDRFLVSALASLEPIEEDGDIMHDKFFVIDRRYVWTGSANLSDSGTGGYNANLVVLIDSPKVAKAYSSEFEQMYTEGLFHHAKMRRPPQTFDLGNDKIVTVAFPPGEATLYLIRDRLRNARTSIDLAIFYLTHKELTRELIDAHVRGVRVRVIVDATSATNGYTKHELLRAAGVPVKVENWGGKMHAKAAVIDDAYTIAGSMNWTVAGTLDNDENVLIIQSQEEAAKFRDFFDGLWRSIPETWLKSRPDPEGLDSGTSCTDGVDNDFDEVADAEDPGCSGTPPPLGPLPPYQYEPKLSGSEQPEAARMPGRGGRLEASESAHYVGAIASVCGKVVDGRRGSRRTPTLLNLGRSFPDQEFTVAIWDQDLKQFDNSPVDLYWGRNLCFFGEIRTYRGSPQMVVSGPDQITSASE